jgi:hypothetical protein
VLWVAVAGMADGQGFNQSVKIHIQCKQALGNTIQDGFKACCLRFCNCSVHTVDCHSPALDSGFRRNDAFRQAISWFAMPTKVGIQIFFSKAQSSLVMPDSIRHPDLFLESPKFSRHAGLDPASRKSNQSKRNWIPAFAGMTELKL